MAGLITDLIAVLNEQSSIYEELAAIAENKKEMIVKSEIDGLRDVGKNESELIGKAQKLDKKRDNVVADIATVLNISTEEITLTELIKCIEKQPECEELKMATTRIQEAAENMRAVNDKNRVLLENALEFADYSINVIRSAMEVVPASYDDDSGAEPPSQMSDIRG